MYAYVSPKSNTVQFVKINYYDYFHASSHLWNQLPDSFRQPRQSCLETYFLIHLSAHLCHHHHSHHPSHLVCFTPGSKIPFQQIIPTLILLPVDCLMIMGLDRTYHASRFILVRFFIFFLFVPCGRLSWLPVSFLLHVKYTLSYRIVSCCDLWLSVSYLVG